MMTVSKIRADLGNRAFEIHCTCGKTADFLIDLEKERISYDPKTGIVRCPGCEDGVHKKEILLEKEPMVTGEESRKIVTAQNPETGERVE